MRVWGDKYIYIYIYIYIFLIKILLADDLGTRDSIDIKTRFFLTIELAETEKWPRLRTCSPELSGFHLLRVWGNKYVYIYIYIYMYLIKILLADDLGTRDSIDIKTRFFLTI